MREKGTGGLGTQDRRFGELLRGFTEHCATMVRLGGCGWLVFVGGLLALMREEHLDGGRIRRRKV